MAGTQASSRPGPSARIRSAPMPLALHPAQDTPPKTRGRASGFLLSDRDRLDHLDPVAGDAAAIGNDLDPGGARGVERLAIGRIDVAGELETLRRPDLDQEQHYRARLLRPSRSVRRDASPRAWSPRREILPVPTGASG